jgi:hypothetical protein
VRELSGETLGVKMKKLLFLLMLLCCMGAYVAVTQFELIDSDGDAATVTNGNLNVVE